MQVSNLLSVTFGDHIFQNLEFYGFIIIVFRTGFGKDKHKNKNTI